MPRGLKRKKIKNDDISENEVSAIAPSQSLLLCLESALKSDAHEGGSWIRNEEGKRFSAILGPFGKLLHAKLPQKMKIQFHYDIHNVLLLPGCLPTLSELLEDEEEDIMALAKHCISEGDELLGESLEESLR